MNIFQIMTADTSEKAGSHVQPHYGSGPSRSKKKLMERVKDVQNKLGVAFPEGAAIIAAEDGIPISTVAESLRADESAVQDRILDVLRDPHNNAKSFDEAAQLLADEGQKHSFQV